MKSDHPDAYLLASGSAALINFPLWRASTIAQSNFMLAPAAAAATAPAAGAAGGLAQPAAAASASSIFRAAFQPPFRGVPTVLLGMTWARAAIFYGSARGKEGLRKLGFSPAAAAAFPPMAIATAVQVINAPIVRATITMQDPMTAGHPHYRNTYTTLRHIAETRGVPALWKGLAPGLMKAVPKYVTAVVAKDLMERYVLPEPSPTDTRATALSRSAFKSVVAGLAGAVLTNPFDVLRNHVFKTDASLLGAIRRLRAEHGTPRWMWMGVSKNIIAVSVPVTLTIFFTDIFIRWKENL